MWGRKGRWHWAVDSALLSSCGTSQSLGFPTCKMGAHMRSCLGSSAVLGWHYDPFLGVALLTTPHLLPTSERAGVAGPGVQIVAWESGYFCL